MDWTAISSLTSRRLRLALPRQMRHDVLDHPHPGVAAERHDRFRVELHGRDRLLGVLDAHDRAILAFSSDDEIRMQRGRVGEDRVVTTDGHFPGKAREDDARLQYADARR